MQVIHILASWILSSSNKTDHVRLLFSEEECILHNINKRFYYLSDRGLYCIKLEEKGGLKDMSQKDED